VVEKRWVGGMACGAACAAALAASVSASVQVGSSGWQWGNPLPQGNTLRSMSFVGGLTGYAAGDFGTLLKTTDGGASWSGLPVGTYQNLGRVQALDAGTVLAGGGCVMRLSKDGGQSFTRIAFTPVESSCPQSLSAFWFVSASQGYIALDDGTVVETKDGGETFSQQTAVPGTRQPGGGALPTDLVFLTPTSGFATTTAGQIFSTGDEGRSWKQVMDVGGSLNDMTFVDSTHGFAVGAGSRFLRTDDGGVTWTPKDLGTPPLDYTSVTCADVTTCVVATRDGKQLIKVLNGGNATAEGNVSAVVTPSSDAILTAAFASPTQVTAAGMMGSTVMSGDAATTFSAIGGRLNGTYFLIRAGRQPGTAFAPGTAGSLAKTLDAGRTWTRGNVSTSQDVRDVSFPTSDVGYALDAAGGVFRTANGGDTWKGLDTGTTARPNAIFAPTTSTVLAVGPRGIRRSTDAGGVFSQVKGKVAGGSLAKTSLFGVDRAGSTVVAWGRQDLIASANNGAAWKLLRKPGAYKKVRNRLVNRYSLSYVDFLDARHGFVVGTDGRVWKTATAGRSWSELPSTGTEDIGGISFASATKGYLVIPGFGDVARGGFLLRTTDGGTTWHPQFVVKDRIASQGIATGGAVDYLLGGDQALLFSASGGDAGQASTLSATTRRTKLTKPAHITVTGKVTPAEGGERVTVSYRRPGSTSWRHQTVKTAANGSFTTSWNVVRGDNQFVAQWPGDFRSAGDGSKTLHVIVGKVKRR
jgi:photosystem II stability/assembly factor-like uncharacterized protein